MDEALVVCEERGDGFEAFAVTHVPGARSRQPRAGCRRRSPTSSRRRCSPRATVTASGSRGWSATRAGSTASWPQLERARELDARALALARENPSPWTPEIDALLNLCVDGVRAGDPEGAHDAARAARGRHAHARLVPLDERAAPRGGRGRALRRAGSARGDGRAGRRGSRPWRSRLGARNYLLRGRAHRRRTTRSQADGSAAESLAKLEHALAAFAGYAAPLETWKSRRVLGLLRTAPRGRARRAGRLRGRGGRRRHDRARHRPAGPARELPRKPARARGARSRPGAREALQANQAPASGQRRQRERVFPTPSRASGSRRRSPSCS